MRLSFAGFTTKFQICVGENPRYLRRFSVPRVLSRVLISVPSWTDGHTWYQSQGGIDLMAA